VNASIEVDIIHGKLHVTPSARVALQDAVLTWSDGPATLTIERETATRSQQANNYYWAVVVKALADHTGYTPDETHEVLKIMFLPKDVALATGTGQVIAEFVIGGSTRGLSVPAFFDYVERIRQWAFEALDVDMPPPDPAWRGKEDPRFADRELATQTNTDAR
jgi:hypothetical protein